jgi:hypothetical protein
VKPWTSRDLTSLVGRVAVGLVVMAMAIYQAGGKATVAAQLPWASWAVGGFVIVGLANGLWLLALRQTIGRRYRLLFDDLTPERVGAVRSVSARRVPVVLDESALVAAAGMTRFHRARCLLASGKTVKSSSRAGHRRAGRQPCGVCEP